MGGAPHLLGGNGHRPVRLPDISCPQQPDRPRRRSDVEANEAHGRIVLVRPDDGGFYLLDELGALIWELCDGGRSVEEVIAGVAVELDRPASGVAGDVREWIAELRTERLVVT